MYKEQAGRSIYVNLKLSSIEIGKKTAVIIFGALLNAIGMNLFLIPANVYASGFVGVAQLLSSIVSKFTPIVLSTGMLYIVFNIPIVILGWRKIGKSFTLFSFVSIAFMTLFLEIVPVLTLSHDIMLNAVFGGVILAIGSGLTLKWGASTGGMDIIVMILSRVKERPLGTYFFTLNSLIILTAGAVYGWEKALYTLVGLYASSRVIDMIHTRHVKVTVFIVTKNGAALRKAIQSCLVRGITTLPATGAFTNEQKEMLMIVITRYELYAIERIINEVDPKAFANVVHTESVLGLFRKD